MHVMENISVPDRTGIVEAYTFLNRVLIRQSCVDSQANAFEVTCLPLKVNLGVFEWKRGKLVPEYFSLVNEYNALLERIDDLRVEYGKALSLFVEEVDSSCSFENEEEMGKNLGIDVPSDYFDDKDGYKVQIFAVTINKVRIPLELLEEFFDGSPEEILTKFLLYKEKLVVDNNVFGQMLAFSVDLYTHDIIRGFMEKKGVSNKISQVWDKVFLGK